MIELYGDILLNLNQPIKKGKFGSVWKALWNNHQTVAVKLMQVATKYSDLIIKEVSILHKIRYIQFKFVCAHSSLSEGIQT
jgi:hypothetical protein